MPDILINDIRPRTQVLQGIGPAATNSFDFGFPILAESDLKVAVGASVLDPSDYTVTGVGDAAGGSVTLSMVPAEGARVTMWRDMPFQRTTDFTPGADLRAAVLNDELDRTALLLQQAEALVGDSIHRRPYDTDVELILPTVEDRAGMLLSFDSNGQPETVNAKISGNISSFALIYLGAAPTADAPTTRMDGSALQVGDFYFDTDRENLMAYTGTGWAASLTGADNYLPRDGSAALTGPLDMGGNSISNVGTVDGRSVGADGAVLDSLSGGTSSIAETSNMTVLNAWEIARLDGLGPQGLINTYLDIFTDTTGISQDSPATGTAVFDSGETTNALSVANWGRTVTGSGANWSAVGGTNARSTGKLYFEVTHTTTNQVGSTYTVHGIKLTSAALGSSNASGHYTIDNDGRLNTNGSVTGSGEAAFDAEFTNGYIPSGTVGCCAVDIDNGRIWLGFIKSDNTAYWHGGGDPATDAAPSATFTGGLEIEITANIYNAYQMDLNTGQEPFANSSVPSGFIAGWHNDDGVVGLSANVTHDSVGGYIHNPGVSIVLADGGYNTTVFDGVGGLDSWSISHNNTGVVNASAGTVDGKTCISFVTGTPMANNYAQLSRDFGSWGSESLTTYTLRFNGIANLGSVANESTLVPYPHWSMYHYHDSGRRSVCMIQGDGSLAIMRSSGNEKYKFVPAGTFQDDTWYEVTIWQRIASGNHISDFKCWVDGVLIADQSGLSIGTEQTGSDGHNILGFGSESGNGGTTAYLHSIRQGIFPVTGADTFYHAARDTYGLISGGSTGDFAQSFQVANTNPIVGGGIGIYDNTNMGSSNSVTFSVYPDTSGAPDTGSSALATCTADIRTDGRNAAQSAWFTFDAPFTPAMGVTYWLVVESATGFRWMYDQNSAPGYANGNLRFGGTDYPNDDFHFWIAQDNAAAPNMTSVSQTVTAASAPTELRAILDIEEVDAAAENTDFEASVSRDNGASWSTVSLSAISGDVAGRAVYAGNGDVSGQPSDMQCRLRLTTANGKRLRLHRWALQADQALSL